MRKVLRDSSLISQEYVENHLRTFRLVVLVMSSAFVASCGVRELDVERVRQERCSRCDVVKWGVGEGDGSFAYVHATLRCPERYGEHEEIWQFRNDDAWGWVAASAPACSITRSTPKELDEP